MKTISQVTGLSVYAIVWRAGAVSHQLRRCEVGETTCKRQDDEAGTEGRDRRRPSMRDGKDREGTKCYLEGTSAGLRRDRKRCHQCVCNDADSDRSEQECLQSPHAILPSPPTTVSDKAWAASGQPAIVRLGAPRAAPPRTSATPSVTTTSGPARATMDLREGLTAAWRT
jgi:hypothetical protein